MHGITREEIERLVPAVDYTEVLTITAGEEQVLSACRDARRYGFRAVVAFPQHLGLMVDQLAGSGVLAQIPVGYPCGGHSTYVKCVEAEEGLNRGANDLDMVMNISAFKAGDYDKTARDITAVREIAAPFGVPFKVIIEVGVLTDAEIVTAARLVADCGADFVKTCTGFGPGRATAHAVGLIRATVGPRMGIKASGGVTSLEDAVMMMRAGATVVSQRSVLVRQLSAMGWPTRELPAERT